MGAKTMIGTVKRFLKDEQGATAIEYGLIIAVLSLAIVGGFSTVANSLTDLWSNKLAGTLDSH